MLLSRGFAPVGTRSRPLNEIHVELEGAVDLAVAPDLRARLRAASASPQEDRLVLDLSRTTLLDAAAMGVIAGAARTYAEVELRGACPVLRRALEAGGLTELVRVG
jgi:anti-anti-sigma factor